MVQIGITERGDAALNTGWKKWVENGQPAILITKNVIKLILTFAVKKKKGKEIGTTSKHQQARLLQFSNFFTLTIPTYRKKKIK